MTLAELHDEIDFLLHREHEPVDPETPVRVDSDHFTSADLEPPIAWANANEVTFYVRERVE